MIAEKRWEFASVGLEIFTIYPTIQYIGSPIIIIGIANPKSAFGVFENNAKDKNKEIKKKTTPRIIPTFNPDGQSFHPIIYLTKPYL